MTRGLIPHSLGVEFQKQNFARQMPLRARILGPVNRFRIAQIMPQMSRASRASRSGYLLVAYASSAIVFVHQIDLTLREKNKCVELDESYSLSRTATNVVCCTTFLPQFGGMLRYDHEEVTYFMT